MIKINKYILVADDEKNISDIIKEELELVGYTVDVSYDGEDVVRRINSKKYDLLVMDNKMPKMTGIEVMEYISKHKTDIKIIMMTAFGTINDAVYAMKLGAIDYITKPFDNDVLVEKIDNILSVSSHYASNTQEGKNFLIGVSKAYHDMTTTVNKIKNLPTTVLITGESGTGKSILAKEIHYNSIRSKEPFIHVNCAVLPSNLIESELFGHVKGSFTGATSDKKGKFEVAGAGTIFLDEISTLNIELQAKLLTVLQEKKFEKIGSSKTIDCSARIIAATNANLNEEIRLGRFREDLFYRLNIIAIECPSLRMRKEDIKLLVDHFVNKFSGLHAKNITSIDDALYGMFNNYDWPGNIRELENVIERLVAMNTNNVLNIDDLMSDPRFNVSFSETSKEVKQEKLTIKSEYQALIEALEINNNHREKTAQYLGISRRTLQYRLKKYDLKNR